jgi:hypothetical protein
MIIKPSFRGTLLRIMKMDWSRPNVLVDELKVLQSCDLDCGA